MAFDFDTPKTFIDKANKAVDWIAEDIFRQKNWRSLLILIDVVLFLAFNPFQWPFPNLLTPFRQLLSFGWYQPVFWSLITVIFASAVVVAARTKRKPPESADVKPGAIKGLLPFVYEDAEDFAHLQRGQNLKECLQAICDDHWRFGVLSGESGVGKSSFLQAGLWPALEKRRARCVYVKFSDLDPFEAVRRACRKHLPACNAAADDADFLNLLIAATTEDSSPIVLLFDQFEQFFVHFRRESDRAPFVQALTRWFTEMESLQVKLLICIRGDFHDRLFELHIAMKYSLGPTQSFRLKRFEPDQATEILCFLAKKEGFEYDPKFISEMARQELADSEDGLISPVDVQVLARMIQRQTVQEGRAFNRSTFQKLGGVEGLLDRYLTSTLETRETQARRQTGVKVLLTLTDLERNTRAGALTTEAIREKLKGDVSDDELKESISWLQRGDVRLIAPSTENEEEKFELAHERMIPALRRLAGKQLSEADRADQLLDRRTNEWLGNGRHARYLFSRTEFRLINKHKRFITWGKGRQAKEELLAASAWFLRLEHATVGLVMLIALAGWIGWNSNAWQTYLVKRELRTISGILNDYVVLTGIARAFVYAGDLQFALQIVERIYNDTSKANALRVIAESCAELGEKEKAILLLADATKMAQRIGLDSYKADALRVIAESIAKLGEREKAILLLADATRTAERISDDGNKAYTLRVIAGSYAELGESMKDSSLLADAIETAERISDDFSKTEALRAIAESIAKLGEKQKAILLLADATRTAERIGGDSFKAEVLRVIAESYAELGVKEKALSLLADATRTAERISDDRPKTGLLRAIDASIIRLGKMMKDSSLLADAIKMVERIREDPYKANALRVIAESIAKLGEREKALSLLADAIETAERISDDFSKTEALRAIAESYAELGETMKDSSLLADAIETAERIGLDLSKAKALRAIAESYAELGEKEKALSLLADATRTAERIGGDSFKAEVLRVIAESYAELGEKEKAVALLADATRTAERIGGDSYKAEVLRVIAESYAELGEKEKAVSLLADATRTAERIGGDSYKAEALIAIVESYTKLAEASNSQTLYDETFSLIDGVVDDLYRNKILNAILSSKLAVADVGNLRSLTTHYGIGAGKARALAAILTACSRPELIKKKDEADDVNGR
jgi:tetratricopeptide (TPR) repeat protein